MEIDYLQHDSIYALKRDVGEPGWQSRNADQEVKEWMEYLMSIAQIKSGWLLELGCGAGNISEYLVTRGLNIVGIDVE